MRLQVGNQVIDLNFPKNQFGLVIIIVAIATVAFAASKSFYQVEVEEEAVVTRFGKYIKTVRPGLHFRIPFVDDFEKVEVRRQHKLEFGFGTSGATNQSQYTSPSEQAQEKAMVTGDLNAALVEWVIQYRISDPQAYLFNVRQPVETLRDASESVMREVVGDRTVDEVITVGRQDIESTSQEKLSALAQQYELGITIDQVQLKDVDPPKEVQSSFNEVNQAQQEREKAINVANGEYNKVIPKARGDADKLISEAEGYATKRINEAEGNAAKFIALYNEFAKNPDITKKRIYLETMERVMPRLGKKVIVDEGASQVLPLLPLSPANLTR